MALCVVRSSHMLVKPCEKTPTGPLELSGMDKVPVLRCYARTLHIYKSQHNDADDNVFGQLLSPEKANANDSTDSKAYGVIREALSKALVPYYPLAGRLRYELGEIQIECSGEGVLLVEASANCTLHSLNYLNLDDADISNHASYDYNDLLPQQLHSDHPLPDSEINDQPLVQMQVTQFACGGFVIGLIFSHTVCDGLGAAQFLNAVGEFARGLDKLSVQPVWCRDFFVITSPPQLPTKAESAAPPLLPPMPQPSHKLEQANVDISMDQINKLKRQFEEETGQRCSSFEIVTASLWRCRTRAISSTEAEKSDDNLLVRFVFFANCRHLVDPPLPQGFYGNCFFPVSVKAQKQWLARAGLSEVVKLIQKAKAELPKEFEKYRNNKCKVGEEEEEDPFMAGLSYETMFVSEWGRLGFNDVDFGWGRPLHIVPIQGSPLIPAAIVGWQPPPEFGIRLITWCVHLSHRQCFLHLLSQLTN